MNNDKDILQILAQLSTLQNLRVSKIEEQEVLVLNCFLLLLAKNRVVLHPEHLDSPSNIKETINRNVLKLNDGNIKWLYENYLKEIIEKVHLRYIIGIADIFFPLKSSFLNGNAAVLVDTILSGYFNRFSGSTSMQPKELSIIMNHFLGDRDYKSYYNPFSGLSSLATNLPEHIMYFGEEVVEVVCLLGQLRILIHNPKLNFKIEQNDCIYDSTSKLHYDFIAFNPPFKLRLEKNKFTHSQPKSEYYSANDASAFFISKNFRKLNKNGRMVFVTPSSFLYSNSKPEKALKKFLVENNHIESIIALPKRVLSFTEIEINLVVLTKDTSKAKKINFIDATELIEGDNHKLNRINSDAVISLIDSSKENNLIKFIPNKTIVDNQFNLVVNRYVFEPLDLTIEQHDKLVKIKDIVNVLRPIRSNDKEGIFIKISDLSDKETTDYTKTFQDVTPRALRSDASLLEHNSILLSLVGNQLKPSLFKIAEKPVYYPDNHMLAVQVDEEQIDIEYLIFELRKDYIQKQLERKSRGAVMPRISRNELMQVQVVLPAVEEQRRIKYNYIESIINEQQANVKGLMLEYGIDIADENSFLRHKIAGTLKNLRGSFSKLKHIIDNQVAKELPEVYNLKVDNRLESNFSDYLNRMERDLNSILGSVQAVGVELNLDEKKFDSIEFLRFVKNYVEEVQSRKSLDFDISLSLDEAALNEHKIKEIIVSTNNELLHQAFDNIIENAERHAFIHDRNSAIEVITRFDLSSMNVIVEFANNGIGLQSDFTMEKFLRKGNKSSLKGGKGIGGWMIHEIMKRHNGSLSITDYNNEYVEGYQEIKTGLLLTFPFEIKI